VHTTSIEIQGKPKPREGSNVRKPVSYVYITVTRYAYTYYIQDRNCLASPAGLPDPPVDAPLPATLVLCRAPPLFVSATNYLPPPLARSQVFLLL